MDIVSYIIAGGGVAIVGVIFIYISYLNSLKEQVTKDATEKARLNNSINNMLDKIDGVMKTHKEGIQNYYNLQSDVRVLEQVLNNLILRYNRDHKSTDLDTIKETKDKRKNGG